MYVRVDSKKKAFGRSPCRNFSASVDYACAFWERGQAIDFAAHPEFARQLSDILLGQICPVDLRGASLNPIVSQGESIDRHHLKAIMKHWEHIDFSQTPWRQAIRDLQEAYLQKRLKQETENNTYDVVVKFNFRDSSTQKSGSFAVSPSVATWLGEQLIKAGRGEITNEVKAEVIDDKVI